MYRDKVFYIGLRYAHHARHSGYEAFGRYVGTALPPPVRFRWTRGRIGWPINQAFCRLTRHPWYSIGAHLIEWSALQHMMRHRQCLYHVLYGDTDIWLLRRANQISGNRLIASFHQPTAQLKHLGSIERVARHLDGVILVCEAQRAYFEEFMDPERIFVVHLGVDTDFFLPPDRPSGGPVCVTVGAHLRDFGTFRLAIKRVWEKRPEVRFIAVGTRSNKKFYFSGLDDPRIQYLDRVSDEELLRSLHAAQVAAFSFQDATANTAILEAMASGLPVVATNVGGISEYIEPDFGILCPEKDPEAMAAGILHILDDSGAQRRMAQASRARAMQLDFRLIADDMARVYGKILGEVHPG